MQGLATRTMLQHINTNPLPDDLLAPECEAPRPDSFGLASLETERRRARIERLWQTVWKVGFWAVMLLAAAVLGANSKVPNRQPFFIERPVGALTEKRSIDYAENCFVVAYTDAQGRERHKNTHCPALLPNGLMAWPLEARAQ
jgi:hypothetical protein